MTNLEMARYLESEHGVDIADENNVIDFNIVSELARDAGFVLDEVKDTWS